MAEFATAALSAVGTALAGVATAGAEAGGLGSLLAAGTGFGELSIGGVSAASGSSLLSGGSLFSSILQGGASLATVMAAMNSGEEGAQANMARANDAVLEQGVENVRGIERRDSLRRSLLERLGQQDVVAASSGVDLSFGTPAIAREESIRDGERALTQDQNTQDLRVSRLQERADEFQRAARSSRRAGNIKAFGAGVSGLASITRRG
jgi:hypothetical protein